MLSGRTPEWLEKRNLADLVTEEDKVQTDMILASLSGTVARTVSVVMRAVILSMMTFVLGWYFLPSLTDAR